MSTMFVIINTNRADFWEIYFYVYQIAKTGIHLSYDLQGKVAGQNK